MQFADIKNDIAFRKIFGWAALRNKNKTEILISFLNAVLKLEGSKNYLSRHLVLGVETPS